MIGQDKLRVIALKLRSRLNDKYPPKDSNGLMVDDVYVTGPCLFVDMSLAVVPGSSDDILKLEEQLERILKAGAK